MPRLTSLQIEQHATDLEAAAQEIMRVDGDRDHMSQSNLKCEQTQAIARYLRILAKEARAALSGKEE